MVSPTHSDPVPPVRWGVIGPGEIARVFASACQNSDAGTIELVLGRSAERADAFAQDFGAKRVNELDQLLRSNRIDAVYVATPHPMHARFVRAAIEAGRAVLCEKPLTVSREQTAALCDLARERGVLLLEGWMYRAHPQIGEMTRLLNAGAIGKVHAVNACFGVACAQQLPDRILSPELAGGVIYDIGGYPVSAAMLVDQTLGGGGVIGEITDAQHSLTGRGVELDAQCVARFESGLTASLACSFEQSLGLSIQIMGDQGSIRLPHAFLPEGRRDGTRGLIELTTNRASQTIRVDSTRCCFSLQAHAFARLYRQHARSAPMPMVSPEESVQIAAALDLWKSHIPSAPDPADAQKNPAAGSTA